MKKLDLFEPLMSKETLEYHYGKHHLTYYNKLLASLKGHELENKSLEYIVKHSSGGMFNNAA